MWADVDRFLDTNNRGPGVTAEGTRRMLDEWRKRTQVASQRKVLWDALEEAGLVAVAEKYLPSAKSINIPILMMEIQGHNIPLHYLKSYYQLSKQVVQNC